jgi:Tfp pilus assembly protein PilO
MKFDIKNLDLANVKNLKKEDLLRNKVLLIGIAMAVFSVWYGYNKIYIPIKNAINSMKSDLSQEGVNADILKRLVALDEQLGRYQKVFARGADVPWLVDRISSAAVASGLTVASLESKPLVRKKQFFYSRANLTATGTFHQLGDFVSKLESSKEFIKIEKLVFKKQKGLIEAQMAISAYFLK